jgi:hypothetical protein
LAPETAEIDNFSIFLNFFFGAKKTVANKKKKQQKKKKEKRMFSPSPLGDVSNTPVRDSPKSGSGSGSDSVAGSGSVSSSVTCSGNVAGSGSGSVAGSGPLAGLETAISALEAGAENAASGFVTHPLKKQNMHIKINRLIYDCIITMIGPLLLLLSWVVLNIFFYGRHLHFFFFFFSWFTSPIQSIIHSTDFHAWLLLRIDVTTKYFIHCGIAIIFHCGICFVLVSCSNNA